MLQISSEKCYPLYVWFVLHVFVLNCSGGFARVSKRQRHTWVSNYFVPVTELSSHWT